MADPIVDLKIDVENLKKDVVIATSIQERLDTAIGKLTEVSGSIKSMLAVHEEKLSQQEKVDEIIFTKLKDRQDQIEELSTQLRNEMDSVERRLLPEIKALRNDIGGRVGVLEKYRWIILGGAIVIGWIVGGNFSEIIEMMK